MSLTIDVTPHGYDAGYSAIPLSFYETNYNQYENFKYIASLVWNATTVNTTALYNIGTIGYTKLTTQGVNEFKVGQTILLDDVSGDNRLTGYYNIIKVVTPNQFVVDLLFDIPNTQTFSAFNVIKYTLPPDLNGNCKIDLSNMLKNFVTDNLSDEDIIFEAPNSRFEYNVKVGYEYEYKLLFTKADTSGTHYKLINPLFTNPNQIDYSVGDEIVIEQEVTKWDYYDNNWLAGQQLGFIGHTVPPFINGKGVEVTGQQYIPSYNGPARVVNKLGNILQVNKTFAASTPADDGSIYGLVTDVYNTVGKITSIQHTPGTGLVVTTDIKVSDSTTAGAMTKFADGRLMVKPRVAEVGQLFAYNARIPNEEYTTDAFDGYVTKVTNPDYNKISTIYNRDEVYDIERTAKSYLLFHMINLFDNEITPTYTMYNAAGSVISEFSLRNNAKMIDYHFPIGLNQLSRLTEKTPAIHVQHAGSVLHSVVDDVVRYEVRMSARNPLTPWTQTIKFNVKDDCKSYELLHLMWKDALGSWISLPFNMKSYDNLEVSRKTYYKKEGNWDNKTFGYNDLDRGEKNYFSRSRASKRVNSGWMRQQDVRLVSDLFKSASVYIQDGEGRLIPAHIDEHEIELIKNENNDMIQYEFNLRFSTNDYRF